MIANFYDKCRYSIGIYILIVRIMTLCQSACDGGRGLSVDIL